ncbi:MAG: hypothetical protein J6T76_06150 [Paludibacteraceae bacterium]|nr:hypothetical protein [Paludibacteraceae bacterium]
MKKAIYQSPISELVYLSGRADVMQGIELVHHSGGGGGFNNEDQVG